MPFFNAGMQRKIIGIQRKNSLNFKASSAQPIHFYKIMLIQRSYLIQSTTAVTEVDAIITALINRIDRVRCHSAH